MRSPVSRIAAAAIFVLAITGVALFFPGSGGTFAFDDFAAPILEAKTVKCKMIIETKGPPARTITSEIMTLGGTRMRQVTELPAMPKFVMLQLIITAMGRLMKAFLKKGRYAAITAKMQRLPFLSTETEYLISGTQMILK